MRLSAALLALAVPVLAAVGLAACGDMPQPFRHEGIAPELARPQQARAVTVRPVDESPGGREMARSLVKALADREIPAIIGDGVPGAMLLHGSIEDGSAGGAQMGLAWQLDGPDRQPQATTRQWIAMAAWRNAAPKELDPLAAQAIAALTAEGGGAAPADAPPPGAATGHRPTLRLLPPAAAPGDGAAALTRAMKNALERNGILVVGTGGDYIVEAKVELTPGPPGEEVLAVAWTVRRADGTSLATIDQKGGVPTGSLQQTWGGLARNIAEGGATGVAQVIETAGSGH